METIAEPRDLRQALDALRSTRSIGFVPTMGALHEGHLSLIRRARGESDVVVVSIFVNPTQFGPGEDFARYPRPIERDSALCSEAGVDYLFAPSAESIYPPGSQTVVEVPELAALWEGRSRPGHFTGVATVCAKLFEIVGPHRAYFGRKDYQQLKIIQRMARDLFLPLEVIACPTVREADGLALSSRNAYLNPEERLAAPVLFRALSAAEQAFREGERAASKLEERIRRVVASEPLARLEYAAVVDAESLQPVDRIEAPAVALLAVRTGETRLIDNLPLRMSGELASE